jgi:hypothetical protein
MCLNSYLKVVTMRNGTFAEKAARFDGLFLAPKSLDCTACLLFAWTDGTS